jgi:predicted RNase H-like HicB family nuclease
MRYLVVIGRTGTGNSVDVPGLPGCVTTGMNVEDARQMIADAIRMHIELMQQPGKPVPSPSTDYEFAVDDNSPEELCTWVEVEAPQMVSL